ncbi:hypothetical protein BDP81DRAFT_423385 [Colletotrichum phormii]|uniref:Uncharacterized protein n=1 Tax=Colletotrichum phormii TaxID=359342 RepID=A0AAI9ZVP9_9PEZI|nr:uncharacterized protein BDP81DRAFT_423385 [Colletotrichum phormii]KAK1639080.1 hypothetical protein BDP81DRAFT_423385 [Colletotrichum phormii]
MGGKGLAAPGECPFCNSGKAQSRHPRDFLIPISTELSEHASHSLLTSDKSQLPIQVPVFHRYPV